MRNSLSRTSAGSVFGIRLVYDFSDRGEFEVLVARNRHVSLNIQTRQYNTKRDAIVGRTDMMFLGCQSMTVFRR